MMRKLAAVWRLDTSSEAETSEEMKERTSMGPSAGGTAAVRSSESWESHALWAEQRVQRLLVGLPEIYRWRENGGGGREGKRKLEAERRRSCR